MRTDWSNLFKIKIANPDESFQHHEVVKLIIVMKILKKYQSNKSWIRIYTEFSLENKQKPDIYFEDVKKKFIICWEIKKDYSDKWLDKKTKQYLKYDEETPFFKVDFVPINLNKLSKNIEELNKQLDDYMF